MDRELFSRLVKEVLLRNGTVEFPGLGHLNLITCPASFSDRGFCLNPPFKKLVFVSEEKETKTPYAAEKTSALSALYASANSVSEQQAVIAVSEAIEELRTGVTPLHDYDLPNLGRFRRMRDGSLFFVQSQDVEVCPAYDSLRPISLKSLVNGESQTATPAEPVTPAQDPAEPVTRATTVAVEPVTSQEPVAPAHEPVEPVSPAAQDHAEPVTRATTVVVEPVPSQEPAEPVTRATTVVVEPVPSQEPAESFTPATSAAPAAPETVRTKKAGRSRGRRVALWACCTVLVLVVGFFAALAVLGRTEPELVDSLLYSEEQLDVLYSRF